MRAHAQHRHIQVAVGQRQARRLAAEQHLRMAHLLFACADCATKPSTAIHRSLYGSASPIGLTVTKHLTEMAEHATEHHAPIWQGPGTRPG